MILPSHIVLHVYRLWFPLQACVCHSPQCHNQLMRSSGVYLTIYVIFLDQLLLNMYSGVARIFRLRGMRGARKFSSGATVECDRNCFRTASPITLRKLVRKFFQFFSTLEPNIGVFGASAAGASENLVEFANRRQCAHQKLGGHDRGQGKN